MSKNNEEISAGELIEGMANCFNPEGAGNFQGDIQFVFTDGAGRTGKEENYFLQVRENKCSFSNGVSSSPALVITSPVDTWRRICNGELNGAIAFMSGKYKVKGDLRLLMRMDKIFSRKER
ncbi:MAG: SCP2 sterol-binding domain-containing protein [Halanaerobiaceae bacterium]|nr:SCP2 sterol-binding domain-containing protein [Halanaerobiaceae bacterium]